MNSLTGYQNTISDLAASIGIWQQIAAEIHPSMASMDPYNKTWSTGTSASLPGVLVSWTVANTMVDFDTQVHFEFSLQIRSLVTRVITLITSSIDNHSDN